MTRCKIIAGCARLLPIMLHYLICPVNAGAQNTAPSLRELIDSSMIRNHDLIGRQLELALTHLNELKLRDAYLPRVGFSAADAFLLTSFTVKTSSFEIPQLNIKFTEGRNRFTSTSNLATASIGSTALLYSGGKIPHLKKALGQQSNAQKSLMEKSRQDIISDITATYDQLALLAQVSVVLRQSEKRLMENTKTADKTLEYGLTTPYEHQKIEVARTQLSSKILNYENKRALVIEKLFLLTNISKERLWQINEPMRLLTADTLNLDIGNRAELKALDAYISAAGLKIKAEKTWMVPKIEAAGSIGYLGLLAGHISSSEPIIAGGSKLSAASPNINVLPTANIGIGVKWDIFNGHEGKNAIDKATIEKQKLENEKQDALEKLQLNLSNSLSDYSLSISQVTVMQTQRQTAWNALTQANKEYKVGLIKSSQLIDAEEDFEEAALGYIQSVYDQRRAAIALLEATGSLNMEAILQ